MFILIPIGSQITKYFKTEEDFKTLLHHTESFSYDTVINIDGFYHSYFQFRPLWIPISPIKPTNSGILVVDSKKILISKSVFKLLLINNLYVSDLTNYIKSNPNEDFGGLGKAFLESIIDALWIVIVFCWLFFGFLFTTIKLFSSKWQLSDIQSFFDWKQYSISIFLSIVLLLILFPLILSKYSSNTKFNKIIAGIKTT